MKSNALPSFWQAYRELDESLKTSARKAYRLWAERPFHPSLHFKCIDRQENIWSVRVSRGCRAVGVLDGYVVTWLWIGDHDGYERFFR